MRETTAINVLTTNSPGVPQEFRVNHLIDLELILELRHLFSHLTSFYNKFTKYKQIHRPISKIAKVPLLW